MVSFLSAWTLPALAEMQLAETLQMVAVSPPARVAFREERHNALLAEPLQLSGYLEYLGPHNMRKVIEHPFVEAYAVRKDEIEIERDGESKVLPLRKARSLQTMLLGIEAVLAGQQERLTDAFEYSITGDQGSWSMTLIPRSRRVGKHLERILIQGQSGEVSSIRFDLEAGEWHLMEILSTSGD